MLFRTRDHFQPSVGLRAQHRTRRAPPVHGDDGASHAMSIPANDAFSLNSHSHYRSKALSRSPPPSYAFLPNTHSHSPQLQPSHAPSVSKADHAQAQGMSLRQRKPSASSVPIVNGNAAANGLSNGHAHHEPKLDPLRHDHETNGNGVAVKVKASRPPIDWEIPRKVFHSSIGESCRRPLSNCITSFSDDSTPHQYHRLFRYTPLYTPHCRHRRRKSSLGCMCSHHRHRRRPIAQPAVRCYL